MAFESLTDRLAGVFKKLRGHGKLSEADIKAAMREVRGWPCWKPTSTTKWRRISCAKRSLQRAMGHGGHGEPDPCPVQVVKLDQRGAGRLDGWRE